MQYTPPLEQHETVAYNKQVHRPTCVLMPQKREVIIQKRKHEAMSKFLRRDWLALTEYDLNLLPAENRKVAIGMQGLLRGKKPPFNFAIKDFLTYLRK